MDCPACKTKMGVEQTRNVEGVMRRRYKCNGCNQRLSTVEIPFQIGERLPKGRSMEEVAWRMLPEGLAQANADIADTLRSAVDQPNVSAEFKAKILRWLAVAPMPK